MKVWKAGSNTRLMILLGLLVISVVLAAYGSTGGYALITLVAAVVSAVVAIAGFVQGLDRPAESTSDQVTQAANDLAAHVAADYANDVNLTKRTHKERTGTSGRRSGG